MGNFPGPMMTVSAVQRQTEHVRVSCPVLPTYLAPSHLQRQAGLRTLKFKCVRDSRGLLCCAGVICSSFKCSDGTQHLAALLRGRVVFIQDRDTEAHCDLEHGDMERCNVQQSQYLQYLHNIYTISTQYLHSIYTLTFTAPLRSWSPQAPWIQSAPPSHKSASSNVSFRLH